MPRYFQALLEVNRQATEISRKPGKTPDDFRELCRLSHKSRRLTHRWQEMAA